jgi:O-antigen chain-terminating methyltransferase
LTFDLDSSSGSRSWPELPSPDLSEVDRLNASWRVAGPAPAGGSLARRLLYKVRLLAASLLRPQETFNSTVVRHVNWTVQAYHAMHATVQATIDQCQAVVDETLRHRDALAARDRRQELAMGSLVAAHEELRVAVGVLQQATQNLKHELARRAETGTPVAASTGVAAPSLTASTSDTLDSHKYVGFEDQFRGSSEDIRERLAEYLPIFAASSDVLDIGCGRGEFLALLGENGVTARGIDINRAMVEVCREKGLHADEADALEHLRGLPDRSLGGLFAAQVIEHLDPRYLTRLLDAAFDKLRPGAPIVLETINPACWFAFFESYIRDVTHVRPIHPDTLRYLLIATGFQEIDIRYRAPYPEHEKLQPVSAPREAGVPGSSAIADWADTLNANVEKINRLLFTWLDYAAIGRRP